jgi:DNA-binding MarR family transcriptional regulator
VQASSTAEHSTVAPLRDESTEELARDLATFTNRLLVASHRDLFAAIEQSGLTFTQVKVLKTLCEADEALSLGALSDTLGLSLPGISRAVDNLVKRGQVKREEDPRDRRSKLVTATGRGRATYERLSALRLAGIRSMIAELEPEEQQGLADALAPVIRRLGL